MPDPTRFTIPRRRLAIAPYHVAGDRPAMRDVGIIDGAEASFEVENNEYRATDLTGDDCREYVADANMTSSSGTLSVALMSDVAQNLAVALKSDVVAVASGPAAEETCETLAVGDVVYPIDIPDPATLVITDSDVGPTTLTLGTHYEFVAQKRGAIRILDLASLVQPFKINYDRLAAEKVDPMSVMDQYWYLAFLGGNERNSCGGESEEFYRARIETAEAIRIHENAEQRIPQPMAVELMLDRDPARSYRFGDWQRLQASP